MHKKLHIPDFKEATSSLATEAMGIPKKVVIPLRQNIGAECRPLVRAGDEVLTGQKIGDSDARCYAPVHSSVSGKVTEISSRLAPFGCYVTCVTIESDGSDERLNIEAPSKEPLERIKEAGIVGMGGAMFPTHVKLRPPKDKKIDTLIVNGAECEPYITSDHRLMLEQTGRILGGIRIVGKILGVDRVFVGIEKNKADAIEAFSRRTGREDIRVIALDTSYPQGAEKTLIKTITGREVPAGGLPMDVGTVVQNVGTMKAVYDAVVESLPLTERIVTVTGPGVKNPKNLVVRIGTPFSDVVGHCGGYEGELSKIISGGPMMGISQPNDDVPVVKGTTGILVLNKKDVEVEKPGPCIRCSECIRVCPACLMPNMIASYAEHGRFDDACGYGAMDCVECGNCSYVCPSGIRHVHWVKLTKARMSQKK